MEIIRSISVDKLNIDFPANWEEGDSSNQQTFTVTIDGKDYGGGFRYSVDGDWFDVSLNENKFTITAKENFNINDRHGYVVIHHNCIKGDDGERIVEINQTGIECSIEVSKSVVVFPSANFAKEAEDIDVIVNGGNKKYFIKSFKEYIPSEEYAKVLKNDKGIKVKKISDTKLQIISYGQIFFKKEQYYEVVLAHDNNVKETVTIIVRYNGIEPKNDVPAIN